MLNALMTMNWTTIVQSQRRELNSPQPSRSSCRKLEPAWRAAAGTRIRETNAALTRNVAASKASAQPAPTPATTSPASPAPRIAVVLFASRSSAFASCSRPALTTLGTSPLDAGEEERVRRAAHELEDEQLPELGVAREQQQGDGSLRREHDEVGGRHHQVAWDAVGPDAADEDEDDLREPDPRQDEPERGRRAVEVVQHRERERDRRERAAEQGGGAAEKEQPELLLVKRSEPAHAARSRRLSAQRLIPA